MTPYRASLGGRRFQPETWRYMHRYQVIGVNRDGRMALWMHDMGLASDFAFGDLQVLSLWEDTVDAVRDMADDVRQRALEEQQSFIQERQQLLKERWPKMALEQAALLRLNRDNVSVFGPAMKAERNAFYREES